MLTCVFEKLTKISVQEFGLNLLNFVNLSGYIWQFGLKHTDNKLRLIQDKGLILVLENNIRGGISSIMRDRFVKSEENKKLCL